MPPRLPRTLAPLRRLLLTPPHMRHYAAMRERVIHKPTLTNKKLIDEAIPAREIKYIDNMGEFQGMQPLRSVLRSFDRERFHLVCVNPGQVGVEDAVLVCKLVAKDALDKQERDEYQKRKAKKVANTANVLKEVEVSWAISEHDLGHRLKKVREFMGKGNKVAITLGVKKGMAKQTLGAMVQLLGRVKRECEAWGKEAAAPEGEVGKKYMMLYLGSKLKEGKPEATKEELVDAVEETETEETEETEKTEKTEGKKA